jgi:undecaprenyl-diphosphatase
VAWLAARDHLALHWINGHHNIVLDSILIPVSFVGEVGAIWILSGLALIIFGRGRARMTGIWLLASLIVADWLVGRELGHLLYRHRPYLEDPSVRQIGIRWAGNSFPSAHAHSVMVAVIVIGSEYRRLLPALIAFAALTLYSRPYLGMHHPLDTLAGAAAGAAVGLAAWQLRRRWQPAAEQPPGAPTSPTPPAPRDPGSR